MKPYKGCFSFMGRGWILRWQSGAQGPSEDKLTDDKAEDELETDAPLQTKAAALWGSTTRRLRCLHVRKPVLREGWNWVYGPGNGERRNTKLTG